MRGEGLALCEAGTVPGIAPLDGSEGCEGQGQVWVDLGAAARLRGQFPVPEPGLAQVPGQSPLGWAPQKETGQKGASSNPLEPWMGLVGSWVTATPDNNQSCKNAHTGALC